jgi:cellulose biosynthesis protein BcsQ
MHKPDLIVLDMMMPVMDGFEVCQKIRDDPAIASIPVILLTALASKEEKLHAFAVGADDYMTKPFLPDELLARIKAVLRRSSRAQTGEIEKLPRGRVISLYSPKGGVGTTTLAVQLSEAIATREDRPVVLIDLDLPLGGIAPMLSLYSDQHVADLLDCPSGQISLPFIEQFTQRHRSNFWVIPTPSDLTQHKLTTTPPPGHLKPILDTLIAAGYYVIIDLGSTLSPLTLEALRQADIAFVITSGQPVANKLHDTFLATMETLGLDTRHFLPVLNELHGAVDDIKLARAPVARIPQASEQSRARLWLKEQGMQKLISVML